MLGLSLGDDALQETVCFTGPDVAQMFTRCPLFVRAYAPNQERGSGPEKSRRSKHHLSLGLCLPLWSSDIKGMRMPGNRHGFQSLPPWVGAFMS